MEYISLSFYFFLIVVLLVYYTLGTKNRWWSLLLASIFFISLINIYYFLIALISSLVNYLIALYLQKKIPNKRILYLFGLILNILALVIFKYADLIIETLNIGIDAIDWKGKIHTLDMIIPLGISYYTFQSIGYLFNVYKGHEKAETNFGFYLTYTLFFPKVISGPIERSNKFLPQIRSEIHFNITNLEAGFQMILWGLFKKVVIANKLGIILHQIHGDLHVFSGVPLLFSIFLQTIYLYFDFSGYTTIALGLGRLFGFKLTDNFNRPFFATSVTMFWRRWHISLSTWCNDYIFKKIQFKRRKWKNWASMYAAFITFLIIGIWHGPTWNFLILGFFQGLAINYEFFTKRSRIKFFRKIPQNYNILISRLFTFVFFSFTLVFFFIPHFSDAMYIYGNLFSVQNLQVFNQLEIFHIDNIIAFSGVLFVLTIEYMTETGRLNENPISTQPKWMKWSTYYVAILLILFSVEQQIDFVYQQF